jgi:hypothetical protein
LKQVKPSLINSVFTLFLFSIPLTAFSAKHSAQVILLQGQVTKVAPGSNKETPVKKGDSLAEGSTVSTKDRSFAKLLFIDNTQMNLGPNTSIKIEKFQGNSAGVIQVIDGKIRAKVQKDLVSKDAGEQKDKLLIQTKTAAMGVRGTDFMVTYSRANQNTSLLTFESQVAMVKIGEGMSPNSLSEALAGSGAVIVSEGQFSSANPKQEGAGEPVRISPEQLQSLMSNETLGADGGATGEKAPTFRSPIPPGVNSQAFVVSASLERIAANLGADAKSGQAILQEAKTTVQELAAAPTTESGSGTLAGGYVDLNSGAYIAPDPAAGAIFDPVTGLFSPDPSIIVGEGGGIVFAEGVSVSESGEVVRVDTEAVNAGGRGLASEAAAAASETVAGESQDDLDEQDDDERRDDVQQRLPDSETSTDVNFQITTS